MRHRLVLIVIALFAAVAGTGWVSAQGTDADTVDGVHAHQFVRNDLDDLAGQYVAGSLLVSSNESRNFASLASYDNGFGIMARGQIGGAYFMWAPGAEGECTECSTEAYLAEPDWAGWFEAVGQRSKGLFVRNYTFGPTSGPDETLASKHWAHAELATTDDVTGDSYGIRAFGDVAGSFVNGFASTQVGHQFVTPGGEWAGYGIEAYAQSVGGYFRSNDLKARAFIAATNPQVGGFGVQGIGTFTGGEFIDANSSGRALVGFDRYKILGTGKVSFVQNHPTEKDKVIVYTAPEGDEVATYTRGSARLMAGVARVALSPTFAMVTNPELGITAHLTPRGGWSDLYVESVTPSELVVRSREGKGNGAFDYIVYGLRIGFEDEPVIQEKSFEARIPSAESQRALFEKHPELHEFTALARFAAMAASAGIPVTAAPGAARGLLGAVEVYDPEVHGEVVPISSDPQPPVHSSVAPPRRH